VAKGRKGFSDGRLTTALRLSGGRRLTPVTNGGGAGHPKSAVTLSYDGRLSAVRDGQLRRSAPASFRFKEGRTNIIRGPKTGAEAAGGRMGAG